MGSTEWKRKNRKEGKCSDCSKLAFDGKTRCLEHLHNHNLNNRFLNKKRRDLNKCIRCGVPLSLEDGDGRKQCTNCAPDRRGKPGVLKYIRRWTRDAIFGSDSSKLVRDNPNVRHPRGNKTSR